MHVAQRKKKKTIVLQKERQGDCKKRTHSLSFLLLKQMGIWKAPYRFQNCQDNENKVND